MLRAQDRRRLEVSQMYFMRTLIVKTRIYRIRNQNIRGQLREVIRVNVISSYQKR